MPQPWDFAVAFAILSPVLLIVAIGMWYDRRQRRRRDAMFEAGEVAYRQWLADTVRCPTCAGTGRIRRA